jgi:hypothetical protein
VKTSNLTFLLPNYFYNEEDETDAFTVICLLKYATNFVIFYRAGIEPSPLLQRPFVGLLYQPWLIDHRAVGGMYEAGESEVIGENQPHLT